jgi:hypothetical protein
MKEGQSCFDSIIKNSLIIAKGSYVMTVNDRFYLINKIFKEGNSILCDVFEVEPKQKLQFIMGGKRRSIPHFFHSCIKYNLLTINSEEIIEKVIFIPEFENQISTFKDPTVGFLVVPMFKYHN